MNLAPLSKPMNYLLIAVALAPWMYWMITYSGPFRFLTELSQAKLGFSADKLVMLAVLLPLYGALRLVVSIGGADERVVDASAIAIPKSAENDSGEPAARSALLALAATVFMLACTGWWYWTSAKAGALRKVTAADFQAGRVEDPTYVELDEESQPNDLVKLTRGSETTFYLPVAGASLVVETGDAHALKDGRLHVRGVARRGVLNGKVAAAIRKDYAAMPDSPWVIQTGFDPARGKRDSMIAMGCSLLLGGFIYSMRRRAARLGVI